MRVAVSAEEKFHLSRIMWVELDGKLKWTISSKSHQQWFNEDLGLSADRIEVLPRGFIRRESDSNTTIIATYCGEDFRIAYNSKILISKLVLMAKLFSIGYMSKTDTTTLANEMYIGDAGKAWEPIHRELIETDNKLSTAELSIQDVLDYDSVITDLINSYVGEIEELKNTFIQYTDDDFLQSEKKKCREFLSKLLTNEMYKAEDLLVQRIIEYKEIKNIGGR